MMCLHPIACSTGVQSHDILYKVYRDILYTLAQESDSSSQRSMDVEHWVCKLSSRIRVRQ
jgi:hypothetical protein